MRCRLFTLPTSVALLSAGGCLLWSLAPSAWAASLRTTKEQALALAMNGKELGVVVQREREGDDVLVVEKEERVTFERAGTKVRMDTALRTESNAAGRPRRYRYVRTDSSGDFVVTGEVQAGRMQLRTQQAGSVVDNAVELPPGTKFYTAHSAQMMKALAPTDITVPLFVEELSVVENVRFKVTSTTQHCPKRSTCFLVQEHFRSFVMESVVDDKGHLRFGETKALGTVVWPLSEKPPVPLSSGTADLMQSTTWPAPKLKPTVHRVRYRVVTDDAMAFALPEDSRQRVVGRTATTIDVEVRGTRATHGPLRAAQRRRLLQETAYEAISDPRLQKAAADAVDGATTTRAKVAQLNAFVHQHIEEQTLDRGSAPAVVTLEQRKGDCTEHAVLLSALLRTQGIPTRLVDGVVVSGGRLGYHQWVEVQIDDEGMVPADPTFGEFPASVKRLKLAEGASDPQGLMDLGMAAARILRPGTRIEVLEADRSRFQR